MWSWYHCSQTTVVLKSSLRFKSQVDRLPFVSTKIAARVSRVSLDSKAELWLISRKKARQAGEQTHTTSHDSASIFSNYLVRHTHNRDLEERHRCAINVELYNILHVYSLIAKPLDLLIGARSGSPAIKNTRDLDVLAISREILTCGTCCTIDEDVGAIGCAGEAAIIAGLATRTEQTLDETRFGPVKGVAMPRRKA